MRYALSIFATAFVLLGATLQPADSQVVLQYAPFRAVALSNTAVAVKTGRGSLQWLHCVNPSGAIAYVQTYDTTSAVVVGTTTPKLSIGLAAGQALGQQVGVSFVSKLWIAATTTVSGGSAPGTALDCALGIN